MPTYYMDYENGNNSSSGSTWADAWKDMTNGATAARIAPGDTIRIAKSPAPYSIGDADWTDLSKTVTLETAATATIENCETHTTWTANPTGDTTLATIGVATSAKQGSNCVRFLLDSSVQTSIMQAYYDLYTHDTTVHDLSGYQKISFWLFNSTAIVADNWTITLCTDIAGTTVDKTFKIPAIPSASRWVPLTLASEEGGNISATIKSIAVNTGTVAYSAGNYIYLDNIIACTTSGLNLQSLISKNSAEQGGTETWYGIQSIDGVTVLLDNDTNTKANAGEGYSGSTEHVPTYARETIKTAMASNSTTVSQEVMDSGTLAGGNIQFQGGYDTGTGSQTGETFFDGLNGYGYGVQLSSRSYVTLNYINAVRYNRGIYLLTSNNVTITTICANNNSVYGLYIASSNNNTITTLTASNNNGSTGLQFNNSNNNTITTLTASNNNSFYGVYFNTCSGNTITTLTASNNNSSYGIYFNTCCNNTISIISTSENTNGGVYCDVSGWNYINNATITETSKITHTTPFSDSRMFIETISSYARIDCRSGNIVEQAATAGGTGNEWKMSVTNTERASNFPLKFKVAEVACTANNQVTVTLYFKKSHATDIDAKLVTPGGELAGVSETTATAPDDTSRNQLQIQFTPTAAGVVSIEAWAWWVANTADENVIIDDLSVTQA